MRSVLTLLGGLALLAGPAVAKLTSCYQPNGTLFPDDTPCNPNDSASMCCAKGWTCLSDGVCKVKIDKNNYFYRGTCTDKSWNADQCLSRCLNFNSNQSWALGKCRIAGQDAYCCSGDSNCDCETGQGVFNLGSISVSTLTVIGASTWTTAATAAPQVTLSAFSTKSTTQTTSQVTSLAAGASTLSVPPSAQPTTLITPSPSSKGSSSNSVALGAGLGVGLGVPLIAAAVFAFFILRRRNRAKVNHQAPPNIDDEKKEPLAGGYHIGSPNTPFVEADGGPDLPVVEAQGDIPHRDPEYAHQQQVPLVEAEGDTTFRQK